MEAGSFSFNSNSYPISIFSAFAPQTSGAGGNFCVRYEVENSSTRIIEKFYWPLATLEMDRLDPGLSERQSIAFTIPPGPAPTVGVTWLYAFKTGLLKSAAYQRQTYALNNYSALQVALDEPVANRPLFIPAQYISGGDGTRFTIKEPTKFPSVGAEFSGSGARFAAESSAKWDGKYYSISVTIERGKDSDDKGVSAPFATALARAQTPEEVLAFLSTRGSVNELLKLPFDETKDFLGGEPNHSVYIIQQPITVQRANGRACFLAAAYSPVPIPPALLSCDLR
jgi:hypothetical protein